VIAYYFLTFLLILLALGAPVYMFYPARVQQGEVKTRLAYLRERKDAVYENLRDLNFEFKAGKMSEKDYESLKSSMEDEAATILAEMARLEEGVTTPTFSPKGTRV
jgi:hypothetical protein